MISGNMVGSYSQMGKTFIIQDSDGNEITGVVTGEETVFTATADDIKIGKIAATDEGIVEGTDTKTYRTNQAFRVILPDQSFSIPMDKYDTYNYTKFQAMIAEFNTTPFDSTSVSKISINNSVYAVNSTIKLSDVTKNSSTKSIDLNITNDTDNIYIIHYSTYKEE